MFQVVEKRKWYFLISSVLILIGLAVMTYSVVTTGTPFKLGIDFTGGLLWVVRFEQPVPPATVIAQLEDAGFPGAEVTTLGDPQTLQIKLKPLDDAQQAQVLEALQTSPENKVETLRFSAIGPAIGSEVTRAAILATIAVSVVILGFMVIAFRQVKNPVRYGVSAVVAMLHDLLMTLGFFSIMSLLFGWRADALVLTALLTVMSWSMGDTIVVFDRIRENLPKYRGASFSAVADRSLLETVHRSLATQLNAIFVMIAILLFGGVTIKQFIGTMLIGLACGTYSSIFIAVPLLAGWFEGDLLGIKTKSTPVEPSGNASVAS